MKLVIQKFKAMATDWIWFKSMFTFQIESQPISNIDKFSYVMKLIGPKPLEVFGKIPMTDEGYVRAWELLKEKYGQDQSVIAAHTTEIIRLPILYGTKYSKEVREFYDKLSIDYEALKTMKSESKVQGLVIETLDKLVHIKPDLVRNDDRNWETWGFDQLVKELREWLKSNKPPEVTSQPKSEDRTKSLPAGRDQIRGRSYHTPVGRESDDRKSRGKKQGPRCLFCDHPHESSNCNDVKELAERRKYFKGNLAIGYVLIVGANFIKLGNVKNKDARSVRKGTTQVYMMIHILYEWLTLLTGRQLCF